MKRVYLVHVPDFVVITSDEREVRELAALEAETNHRRQLLTVAELRARGDEMPVGYWDPDRELTCREIADEIARKGQA